MSASAVIPVWSYSKPAWIQIVAGPGPLHRVIITQSMLLSYGPQVCCYMSLMCPFITFSLLLYFPSLCDTQSVSVALGWYTLQVMVVMLVFLIVLVS